MKIVHCCLAQFYIDDYGYQENILPKIHKIQGHDVTILASTETFVGNMKLGYLTPRSYFTNDGIPIMRVGYVKWLPHYIATKLRIYTSIYSFFETNKPDIIFIHDIQFLSILEIVRYVKDHPSVRVYADGHADYINSARNWISKSILHGIIYKFCAQAILPYTSKFYGVLPLRIEFMKEVYKIPESKLELLVLGGDLTEVDFNNKDIIRDSIRSKHDIDHADFVIITGGKIDASKNIHFLLEAFQRIGCLKNVQLIVFGAIEKDFEPRIREFLELTNVKYVGWLSTREISNYFLASDVAIFPGTHSVLWEQSIAIGLPGVFKKWHGMHHLDVGGNAILLEEINVESLKSIMINLFSDRALYNRMKTVAETTGKSTFSYYEIAKKSIEA